MSNWPLAVPGGIVGPTTPVTLTSGGANTLGAWVEVASAAPRGCVGFVLTRVLPSTTDAMLYRVAVGAAGSEVVVATFFLDAQFGRDVDYAHIPVALPAGQRVAVQFAAAGASRTCSVSLTFVQGSSLFPVGGSEVWTAGTTPGGGVNVTCGNGAWGTGVEYVASTAKRARALALTSYGAPNAVTLSGYAGVFYGATDVLAAPPITIFSSGNNFPTTLARPEFLPCDIPAASNLRIRTWGVNGNTAQRAFRLHLLF